MSTISCNFIIAIGFFSRLHTVRSTLSDWGQVGVFLATNWRIDNTLNDRQVFI